MFFIAKKWQRGIVQEQAQGPQQVYIASFCRIALLGHAQAFHSWNSTYWHSY